jgi:hypothetical protein
MVTLSELMGPGRNANNGATIIGSNWATYDLTYYDANSNNGFDPGEQVVLDSNRNRVLDNTLPGNPWGTDKVLSVDTAPRTPFPSEIGRPLKQDTHVLFIDGPTPTTPSYNVSNSSFDTGELVVFDINENYQVDPADSVVSAAAPRPPSMTELLKPLLYETFAGIHNKRWLDPYCTITNSSNQTVSTLVQIDGVFTDSKVYEDFSTQYHSINGGGPYPDNNTDGFPDTFGDTTSNQRPIQFLGQPTCASGNSEACPYTIHTEIDRDWMASTFCGLLTPHCNNATLPANTSIDIQGFVYWDPNHADEAWHSYSGWEIHPVTAWRLSQPSIGADFIWDPFTPSVGEPVNFTAAVQGGANPASMTWAFGDGSTATNALTVEHVYLQAGTYTATFNYINANGQWANISHTLTVGIVSGGSAGRYYRV